MPKRKSKRRRPPTFWVPGRVFGDDSIVIVIRREQDQAEIATRLRRFAYDLDERDRACRPKPHGPEFFFGDD
jgi:hypothetical protein